MSIIEKLTEGIVNRDMKKEGAALLNKWSATGLLEGLEGEQNKHNMARLLENQAKELLREASSMGAGDVQGFAAVAFPIVRRVFAGLIANELVSVQPMSLPSGLIFFLDFQFSGDHASQTPYLSRFGNRTASGSTDGSSIYGTDRLGSQITGGVNVVGQTLYENQGGPRQAVGMSFGGPTGSLSALTAADDVVNIKDIFHLDGSLTDARAKMIKYDPDLMSATSTEDLSIIVLDVAESLISSQNPDYENMAAFSLVEFANQTAYNLANGLKLSIDGTTGVGLPSGDDTAVNQVRRLTQRVSAADSATGTKASVRFILVIGTGTAGGQANNTEGQPSSNNGRVNADVAIKWIEFPQKDAVAASPAPAGGIGGFTMPMEMEDEIPEIDIKVDSIAITAQTKKLKAKWSPELGQDLNAYHNLDAEVELTSILSEQVALEIDREILADLVNGAKAAVYYWSRSPGLFVNRKSGQEIGSQSAAPDFTGTVSEWYETLIETINDVSAQIHLKTLRGGANFVVCSPEVANILEFTAGFRANVTADADKGDIGAVKAGSLNRKFDVIVDPYFPRNVVLVGRKGSSFLESGYVYAPYVPLQTTPTIFGVEDFVPRKGVMTRYAKKMVRPDMYGLVICRGLLGESGA